MCQFATAIFICLHVHSQAGVLKLKLLVDNLICGAKYNLGPKPMDTITALESEDRLSWVLKVLVTGQSTKVKVESLSSVEVGGIKPSVVP